MEKMHAIYTQQPKLGNPDTVKQSLQMNSEKIAGYDQDIEKFSVSFIFTYLLSFTNLPTHCFLRIYI